MKRMRLPRPVPVIHPTAFTSDWMMNRHWQCEWSRRGRIIVRARVFLLRLRPLRADDHDAADASDGTAVGLPRK